jgi:hypothetical protein
MNKIKIYLLDMYLGIFSFLENYKFVVQLEK